MDAAAVERIIGATGLPCQGDCTELARKLDWAGTWFHTGASMRTGQAKRRRSLRRALQTAAQLKAELTALEAITFPHDGLDRLIEQMKAALAPEPDWQTKVAADIAASLHFDQRSSFEWLAGKRLPEIYQQFFEKKAGRSRAADTDSVGGPYIRFAIQVLTEMNIKKPGKDEKKRNAYSPEAISRALSDVRKGRQRRTLGKSA